MKFVEENGRNASKLGIVEHHAGEHAFRHHLNPRGGRDPAVEPHAIAGPFADFLAEKRRDPPGRRPGRKTPGLQKNNPPVASPVSIEQKRGHERRLAGTRRRRKHGQALGRESSTDLMQNGFDGKVWKGGENRGCHAFIL